MEMDALSEMDHARIREFTTNVSANLDDSSKSKFSTLIAQYLTNSIKLTGLIKEVRYISLLLATISLTCALNTLISPSAPYLR
jgi:hypothetical protein